MTDKPQLPCPNCDEEFDSGAEWSDHLENEHNRPVHPDELFHDQPASPPPSVDSTWLEIIDNNKNVESLLDNFSENFGEYAERKQEHKLSVMKSAGGIFALILIIASILVVNGSISGSSYTLLLGTLLGYFMTFVDDYLM